MLIDIIRNIFSRGTVATQDELDALIAKEQAFILKCERITNTKNPHPLALYWARIEMHGANVRLRQLQATKARIEREREVQQKARRIHAMQTHAFSPSTTNPRKNTPRLLGVHPDYFK